MLFVWITELGLSSRKEVRENAFETSFVSRAPAPRITLPSHQSLFPDLFSRQSSRWNIAKHKRWTLCRLGGRVTNYLCLTMYKSSTSYCRILLLGFFYHDPPWFILCDYFFSSQNQTIIWIGSLFLVILISKLIIGIQQPLLCL